MSTLLIVADRDISIHTGECYALKRGVAMEIPTSDARYILAEIPGTRIATEEEAIAARGRNPAGGYPKATTRIRLPRK